MSKDEPKRLNTPDFLDQPKRENFDEPMVRFDFELPPLHPKLMSETPAKKNILPPIEHAPRPAASAAAGSNSPMANPLRKPGILPAINR